MIINPMTRELNLKIVYYGPPQGGKTTNVIHIHSRTDPMTRGELFSLKTRADRTIFFDLLQIKMGNIAGLTPRFSLYTVPGQMQFITTRQLVLKGADGVVFVADSRAYC